MTAALRRFRTDLEALAAARPDAVAVTAARDERSFSYRELVGLLEGFGPLLLRHGVSAERPLAAVLPNAVEPFVAFLATVWHGAGYAPLTPEATPREVRRWVETVTPAAALVGPTLGPPQRAVLAELGVALIDVPGGAAFDWLPPNDGPGLSPPEDGGRLYLQTSGTTGDPRALVFETDRLWSSGCAFIAVHDVVAPGARFLNNLPLSYLGGLFNLGLIPLAAGGSTVVADAFSGKSFLDFWQTLERYTITVLWLVPTIVRGLLTLAQRTRRTEITPPAARPQLAFIGTAPIDLATKRAFETTFEIPLLENFALSETTFFTSERWATREARRERSVGTALPYVDLRFAPLADSEGERPTEITVKSPYLALGYRTGDGFVPLALDAEGYFATGDLGHRDADGLVIIDGRRRDVIKKGGLFVGLREIELLAEQHEAVLEAAAVGVPHDFYGESLELYVRLRDARLLDELTAWLRANLVRYKWPEATFAVEDFPRTATGKVRKHLLAAPQPANPR